MCASKRAPIDVHGRCRSERPPKYAKLDTRAETRLTGRFMTARLMLTTRREQRSHIRRMRRTAPGGNGERCARGGRPQRIAPSCYVRSSARWSDRSRPAGSAIRCRRYRTCARSWSSRFGIADLDDVGSRSEADPGKVVSGCGEEVMEDGLTRLRVPRRW